MAVPCALGGRDSCLQHLPGFGSATGALQGLRSHEIAVGVIRMELQKFFELLQGSLDLAEPGVLHGQAIAGEGIARILLQKLRQHGQTVGLGFVCVHRIKKFYTIPCPGTKIDLLWPVLTSSRRRELTPSAGRFRSACRWAPDSAEPATPPAKSSSPMKLYCVTSATWATPAVAPGCRRSAALIR